MGSRLSSGSCLDQGPKANQVAPSPLSSKNPMTVYTMEDVAKHKSRADCWIVIGRGVYDVTKFLNDHPGGDRVILGRAGLDATTIFESVHGDRHREALKELCVGTVLKAKK